MMTLRLDPAPTMNTEYTFNYYRARLDLFPTAFARHIQEAPDFSHWDGDLLSVELEPCAQEHSCVAELRIALRYNRKEKRLTYLLHPLTKTVRPVAMRDLSNLNEIWFFKGAIEEWIYSFPDYEKSRATKATAAIKEDLMAAAWAPARVANWLETGGFDLLD